MVEYPILGHYRALLLPLEIIMTGIILEIAVYFFIRYWKNRREFNPSYVEFDWGVLFISFGLAYSFFIISDYFFIPRGSFLLLGYSVFAVGGFIYSYHIESTKIINTKYIFTGFTSFMFIIYLLTMLIAPSWIQTVASITAIPAIMLLLIYFVKILRKIWKQYKLYSISLFAGFFLWFLGFIGTSDMTVELFNTLDIRFLGDLIIIIGMILLGLSLNSIPSLSEIGWDKQIKYIFFMTKSGICIFNQNFQKKGEMDEVILGGALSALKLILEENLKRKQQLKVISKGNEVFLLEEGEYITGVLVVQQELEILKYILKNLVENFEDFFKVFLKNWNGNLNLFQPANVLINNLLSYRY